MLLCLIASLVTTPVDTNPNLPVDGPPVVDPSDFRSLAGALQSVA